MSEINVPDSVIQQRKEDRRVKGHWICKTCGTKYYMGIFCDTCMRKELIDQIKELEK